MKRESGKEGVRESMRQMCKERQGEERLRERASEG